MLYIGASDLNVVLASYAKISEYERLELGNVWLYKRPGAIAYEYIIFAVHDMKANNPKKPISYIHIDRLTAAHKFKGDAISSVRVELPSLNPPQKT